MVTTPHTRNPDWGFHGTVRFHADPDEAWPIAMEAITRATGCDEDSIRDFLDSRHGRHFADSVADGISGGLSIAPAVTAALSKWMKWGIGRRMSRETGIPAGLPYLLGLVMQCEISRELEAEDV